MQLVVINHLTLDGVMQGPGATDEDTRGGFTHGGWALPGNDPAMFAAIGKRMAAPGTALLLGHRSYDGMLSGWNARGGPFKDALNSMPKYVASRSAATELPWPNSTLLHGDVPAAVADLKRAPDGNLVMMGSGELVRALLPHGLVDEFLLMVHPVLLGAGLRLFGQNGHTAALQLTESVTTATGVLLATYVHR